MSRKIGKVTLTRPGQEKLYLGGVFKHATSFPGNGTIALAVPSDEHTFRKVVGLLLEDGEIIDTSDGFINIQANKL